MTADFDAALEYVRLHAAVIAEQAIHRDVVFAYVPTQGERTIMLIGASYVATASVTAGLPDDVAADIAADPGRERIWVVLLVDDAVAHVKMRLRVERAQVAQSGGAHVDG